MRGSVLHLSGAVLVLTSEVDDCRGASRDLADMVVERVRRVDDATLQVESGERPHAEGATHAVADDRRDGDV